MVTTKPGLVTNLGREDGATGGATVDVKESLMFSSVTWAVVRGLWFIGITLTSHV